MTEVTLEQAMAIGLSELRNLTDEQLKAIQDTLVSVSRSRLRRINKAGLYSPAVDSMGQIRKGRTRNQRIATIRQTRRFLTSKTSTVSGVRQFIRAAERGGYVSKINDPRFWKEARRALSGVGPSVGSETVLRKVANVYTDDPESAADQTIRYFVGGEPDDDIYYGDDDEWYNV